MKNKIYALIDCNNFYASCERVFNPALKNRPIVVLSNNDGCIVARTNEVKALGIAAGTPYFEVKDKLDKLGVLVFSSNYQLYGDMSNRVMSVLSHFSPSMEVYSIDEAFLSLEDLALNDVTAYAHEIKKTVETWTGISISIGLGSTKTLAKAANKIAKKFPEHHGVFNIINHSNIHELLKALKVDDIWGIGRQSAKKLNMEGIYTADQLLDLNQTWFRKHFSVTGLRTVLELQGIPCVEMDKAPEPRKQIMSTRSFGKPVTSKQQLIEAVSSYTAIAAEKLREQQSTVQVITVYITTNRFKSEPQYTGVFTQTLREPCNYTPTLIKGALRCLDQIYRPSFFYKKAGVIFNNISQTNQKQLGLFEKTSITQDNSKIMQVFDKINQQWGRDSIKIASQGLDPTWKMRNSMRSQSFTTQWDQLLTIKI